MQRPVTRGRSNSHISEMAQIDIWEDCFPFGKHPLLLQAGYLLCQESPLLHASDKFLCVLNSGSGFIFRQSHTLFWSLFFTIWNGVFQSLIQWIMSSGHYNHPQSPGGHLSFYPQDPEDLGQLPAPSRCSLDNH